MWVMKLYFPFISRCHFYYRCESCQRPLTCLPHLKLLHVIDKRGIVSLSKLAEQEEEQHEIQFPEPGVFVPWHRLVIQGRCLFECFTIDIALGRFEMEHVWITQSFTEPLACEN